MDQATIWPRLNQIFKEVFDDDSIEIKPNLTAKEVDGWDSLTHIRLILTIEKAFNTKFSALEVGRLASVGDLVNLIEGRTQRGSLVK